MKGMERVNERGREREREEGEGEGEAGPIHQHTLSKDRIL